MKKQNRHVRPIKHIFCLVLTAMLLLLTVSAIFPESGSNAPLLGSSHSNNTTDHSVADYSGGKAYSRAADPAQAVTDAAGAIGGAVSEAGNAIGNVIGDVGDAAGALVSDAGDALTGKNDPAVPFDTYSAAEPGNAAANGTMTSGNMSSGVSWVLILILIAAAAAIFFLLLMPKRSQEM